MKKDTKEISDFVKEGWKIDQEELTSPRGLGYPFDKLAINQCCICADQDEEESTSLDCIGYGHSEEDLTEQKEARELYSLVMKGVRKLLYKKGLKF